MGTRSFVGQMVDGKIRAIYVHLTRDVVKTLSDAVLKEQQIKGCSNPYAYLAGFLESQLYMVIDDLPQKRQKEVLEYFARETAKIVKE